jgi:selenocysteine lyase/cysteine desulfurase
MFRIESKVSKVSYRRSEASGGRAGMRAKEFRIMLLNLREPLLERLNVMATCRASFGMYNTRAEVDHLAQALMKAQDFFS